MVTATWNDTVVAKSDNTVVVEGNHYFPEKDVKTELLEKSDTTSICPWKGKANYYNVVIGDQVNKDAAWYYKEPSEAAKQIKNHIAFWRGVEVKEK